MAAIPFTGERFFPDDLSLGAVDVLLVALGVPAAAAVAARLRAAPGPDLAARRRAPVTPQRRPLAYR